MRPGLRSSEFLAAILSATINAGDSLADLHLPDGTNNGLYIYIVARLLFKAFIAWLDRKKNVRAGGADPAGVAPHPA